MPKLTALAAALLFAVPALAQSPPIGAPVLNQAQSARLITKSDTADIVKTRGIYIGDASACNVSVIFAGDTAAVTLPNLQPGIAYPFAITRLRSASTTCTSVHALR